jgi:hypothetical protein
LPAGTTFSSEDDESLLPSFSAKGGFGGAGVFAGAGASSDELPDSFFVVFAACGPISGGAMNPHPQRR